TPIRDAPSTGYRRDRPPERLRITATATEAAFSWAASGVEATTSSRAIRAAETQPPSALCAASERRRGPEVLWRRAAGALARPTVSPIAKAGEPLADPERRAGCPAARQRRMERPVFLR